MDSSSLKNIKYKKFCEDFCGKTEASIKKIEDHKFLQKYFSVFRIFEETKFKSGIFAIDPLGIYTPIQDNKAGVVCFKKLPFNNQTVYGLHDGNNTELMIIDNFYILFPGVINTSHGFKYIEEFSINPASTVTTNGETVFYELSDKNPNNLEDEDDEIWDREFGDEETLMSRKFIDDSSDEDE